MNFYINRDYLTGVAAAVRVSERNRNRFRVVLFQSLISTDFDTEDVVLLHDGIKSSNEAKILADQAIEITRTDQFDELISKFSEGGDNAWVNDRLTRMFESKDFYELDELEKADLEEMKKSPLFGMF